VSKNIPAKANAGQFKDAVKKFYWDTYGRADINVHLKLYDSNDKETTDSGAATKRVYIIELKKLINGVSTSSILFSKLKTKAQVKIELPSEVRQSSPPMSGKYKVKCVDKNN